MRTLVIALIVTQISLATDQGPVRPNPRSLQIQSLVPDWFNHGDPKDPVAWVEHHNRIPQRLFVLGDEGKEALVTLQHSRVASSNTNLAQWRWNAIVHLKARALPLLREERSLKRALGDLYPRIMGSQIRTWALELKSLNFQDRWIVNLILAELD